MLWRLRKGAPLRGFEVTIVIKGAYAMVLASWIVSRFRTVCSIVSGKILFGSFQLFVRHAMNRCFTLAVL
jgi:hypothetical protein